MTELSPEYTGPYLETLGAALRDLNKLNIHVAYVPTLDNRSTHLGAIQDAQEDLAAIIPDVDTFDDPEES